VIRAILMAQLLSLRNAHGRSRRGSALLSLAGMLLWYGFWTFLAYGAYRLAATQAAGRVEAVLPRGLLLVCLYWQLSPMVSASMGVSLDMRKLLVYPVPHERLFFIETLLRFTTSGEMLLILAGVFLGLLRNPELAFSPAVGLVALAVFSVFNLLVSAGTRSLIERILARRRVRELFVLLMVILVALPRVLVTGGFPFERFAWLLEGGGDFWLPWGAAANVLFGGWFSLVWLLLWCGAAYAFGRVQFARSLRFDIEAAQATVAANREPFAERLYRFASVLLPDPWGAIVEKELRSLSRTPRFRTVFIMGFTFGLLVWLPLVLGRRSGTGGVSQNFLTFVSVYALALLGQVSYLNAFGFDRAAAQVYYLAPVPLWRTLAAKNLAAALFIALEIMLVTAVSVLIVPLSAAKIAEALIVTGVAALYLLTVGNLASVYYPKPINPDRPAHGDPAKRQALVFLLFPLAIVPVLLAYLAGFAFDSRRAFWAVLSLAAAIGAVVYWIGMESAAGAAVRRRESVIAELSRGAGPMTS
jgi:ABC-2 type transport system permease protein